MDHCSDCKWAIRTEETPDSLRECRLNPPEFMRRDELRGRGDMFPLVHVDWLCSHFVRKTS